MSIGRHNLAHLAEQALERHGDHEILFFEGKWHSTNDLFQRSCRVATAFAGLGIAPGDRVVVMMSNVPEVTITYQALWRAGAVITPAIFLLPPDELRHIVSDAEAVAVVTTPEFIPTVLAATAGLPSVRSIVVAGEAPEGTIPFGSLEGAQPGSIVQRDDTDLAALMYTGGTTGRAKGVMLSHENLSFCAEVSHAATHVEGITKTLVPLPLSHSFGLIVTVVGYHHKESVSSVLMRWFDPNGWLQLAQDHSIQISTVVPAMLQMLLVSPIEDFDLSSLRYIVSGGAPLPPDVANAFENRVPNVEILEGYGLTETSAGMTVNRPGNRRLGSVGVPDEGFDIRLLDDDGNGVPLGEVGEVACRSTAVMQGYWKSPEATESAIRDGWFHTGDMGRFDEDGFLFIVDRKKDLIIRNGFNVYPRDVEDTLVQHPAVALAAVIGKPDAMKGEEIVAFVQRDPAGGDVTEETLITFAQEHLGRYKYPREVRFVDAIPLTPVFKIDRKVLRAQLVDEANSGRS